MWMQTYFGKKFSFLDPQPEDVRFDDIIMSLSQTCRFNGHCNGFYSVAQHSMFVALLVKENRYTALLHDAPEAYYGDLSTPFKVALEQKLGSGWQVILDKIDKVVAEALNYEYPIPQNVEHADAIMLATEKRDLMVPLDWGIVLPQPANFHCYPILSSIQIHPIFKRTIYENIYNY